jgi:hypothetical protein
VKVRYVLTDDQQLHRMRKITNVELERRLRTASGRFSMANLPSRSSGSRRDSRRPQNSTRPRSDRG